MPQHLIKPVGNRKAWSLWFHSCCMEAWNKASDNRLQSLVLANHAGTSMQWISSRELMTKVVMRRCWACSRTSSKRFALRGQQQLERFGHHMQSIGLADDDRHHSAPGGGSYSPAKGSQQVIARVRLPGPWWRQHASRQAGQPNASITSRLQGHGQLSKT